MKRTAAKLGILIVLSGLLVGFANAAVNTAFNQPNLNRGLVGWWTFDGNQLINNIGDASGNGNVGRFVGFTATTTVPGVIGQGFTFPGATSKYLDFGQITALQSPPSVSITEWVNISSCATSPAFFAYRSSGSGWVLNVDSTCHLEMWDGVTGAYVVSSVVVPLNKWTLATFTAKSTNFNFSVNASQFSQGTAGNALTNSGTVTIGSWDAGASGGFTGSIDDVRTYSRVLSTAEIVQLYKQGTAALTVNTPINPPNLNRGLVGWYTFDGGDLIGNAADRSGQNNTGTFNGFSPVTPVIGQLGQALQFNGANTQFVSTPSVTLAFPITVSAWVNPASKNSAIRAVMRYSAVGIYDWSNNKFACVGASDVDSVTVPNINQWYLVTCVFLDATTAQTYVNGKLETSGAANGIAGSGAFRFGNDTFNQPFAGSIDDIRIYGRGLTGDEVRQLYAQGTAALTVNAPINPPNLNSGLAAWYTFDGADLINNVADRSGGGNTAILKSFTSTTTVPGVLGQALKFNGSTQSASVGTFQSLGNNFTYALWFQLNSLPGAPEKEFIGKASTNRSIGVLNNKIFGYRGSGTDFSGVTTLTTGVWYHGVLTASASALTLYLNGKQEAQNTVAPAADSSGELQIGSLPGFARNADASLDDVRIYTRTLSPDEVMQLYKQGQ